jgi:phospholipase/carboxylesterase
MLSYKEVRALSGDVREVIIFVHGFGANGKDLLGLAPFYQNVFAELQAVSPDAPHKLPEMEGSFFWFPLESYEEGYLNAQLEDVIPVFDEFVQEILKKYDLSFKDLIICGFSQGTMLSTHYALTREESLKAVIGFSGGILPSIKNEIKNSTPICLIHGEDDEVLSPNFSIDAANIFDEIGHVYKLKLIPHLAHSIDKIGLDYSVKFLQN